VFKKLALASLLVLASGTAFAGSVTGKAVVIDGDTIRIESTTVRLKGVDAPELGTAAGEAAKESLIDLVGDEAVICDLTGEKTHRRDVGFCRTESDVDLNAGIIDEGMALACPRYDDRYLVNEQASALETLKRSSYCVRKGARGAKATPAPKDDDGVFLFKSVEENDDSGESVSFRSCKAAAAAGYKNMRRGQPGYSPNLDRDDDGVACER
jgi:endonuclease YncB( thermonuclease family)